MTFPNLDGEPRVVAVCRAPDHRFSKPVVEELTLLAGLGVEGDAHCGRTVRHRSRVAKDPTQPNLRQVHLLHSELFGEVAADGFALAAGELGENVTTAGLDLLALPRGTRLYIGPSAVLEVTGLRNPCAQIDEFQKGLLRLVLERGPEGRLIRKAGIMSIVVAGGPVTAGNTIEVELPAEPHEPLERV